MSVYEGVFAVALLWLLAMLVVGGILLLARLFSDDPGIKRLEEMKLELYEVMLSGIKSDMAEGKALPAITFFASINEKLDDLLRQLATSMGRTRADVFRLSIVLMKIVLDAKKNGQRLAFINNKDEIVREITLPDLVEQKPSAPTN